MVPPKELILMQSVCSDIHFDDVLFGNPFSRFEAQLPVDFIRHGFPISCTKGVIQRISGYIMGNLFLREIL